MRVKYGMIFSLILILHTEFSSLEAQFSLGTRTEAVSSSHWSPIEKDPEVSVMTHAVWGHTAGLYGSYTFSRYLTLEAGVHYIEKGAKHDVNNATFPFGTMFLDYRYDYLEIPLILKTFWFNIRRFSLYSFGGLYGGFLVNNRYRFSNETWGDSESELGDTQKKDWGFTSGAGIQFQHDRLEIGMEYRYS